MLTDTVPKTEHYLFHRSPGDTSVQFRLIYRGELPAATHRNRPLAALKHRIRRKFHPQLRELWKQSVFLRREAGTQTANESGVLVTSKDRLANRFQGVSQNKKIFRFLPLIGDCTGTSAALEILFLRRESPGGLVKSAGDIDNRMKVLLDALRMPQNTDEIPDDPSEDDDPFYCLLEDDKFVDELTIKTDRLLEPPSLGEAIDDVALVVTVNTILFDPNPARTGFYGR